MKAWKPPPVLKVLEALGAVADGRVAFGGDGSALVMSSDGTKRYTVSCQADGRVVSSDDNASYWQGYLGYPAIAALMLKGELPFDEELARALAGVPWKKLNARLRKREAVVEWLRTSKGVDVAAAESFVEKVVRAIEERGYLRPDKLPFPPS